MGSNLAGGKIFIASIGSDIYIAKHVRVKLRLFSYPSVSTCVLGAQKNRLVETVRRDGSFEYPQHTF